jgi:hypothetical protein
VLKLEGDRYYLFDMDGKKYVKYDSFGVLCLFYCSLGQGKHLLGRGLKTEDEISVGGKDVRDLVSYLGTVGI